VAAPFPRGRLPVRRRTRPDTVRIPIRTPSGTVTNRRFAPSRRSRPATIRQRPVRRCRCRR
jgi:hypothetical protein